MLKHYRKCHCIFILCNIDAVRVNWSEGWSDSKTVHHITVRKHLYLKSFCGLVTPPPSSLFQVITTCLSNFYHGNAILGKTKFILPQVGMNIKNRSKIDHTQLKKWYHYNNVIMGTMASQITSLTIVYSTVHSGVDQTKSQSSSSLAFVWGIPRTTGQ